MNALNFIIGVHVMFVPIVLFVALVIFIVGKIEDRWYVPDFAKTIIALYTMLGICAYAFWAVPFISQRFPLS